MYTTTFYSFKGGVGRTMALVNCAFELANRGRRVLMVDFDLEAPGIEAFLDPYSARRSKGMVDFIVNYRTTREAPDVSDYVYEAGPAGAKLWVMPAGRRDELYASRLSGIDWGQLYGEEDGYLLFEDLKAQWEDYLGPDYVFIDSRTGHTDVSGICTRQLPDSVAILFRLDQQNLDGLRPIVSDVRREAEGPRKKNIQLHFFPSNVPDMDDEDQVLSKQLKLFRDSLDPGPMSSMIRHYDDMAMLEHTVFTIKRKNSRLAKEYRDIVKEIIRHNPEDLDGARDFLASQLRPPRFGRDVQPGTEFRVEEIAVKHRHDPEILNLLARIREREGRHREAIDYLSDAIAGGPSDVDAYCRRAELNAVVGEHELVEKDLNAALQSPAENFYEVAKLVSLIRELAPDLMGELPGASVLDSLRMDAQVGVAQLIASEGGPNPVVTAILRGALESDDTNEQTLDKARNALTLSLIGEGEFRDAMEILSELDGIETVFNHGIAVWGATGEIPTEQFRQVREINEGQRTRKRDSNYFFCLALTEWILGDKEAAKEHLKASRDHLPRRSRKFSPWCYQFVDFDGFQSNLDEAAKMVAGEPLLPSVFRNSEWYSGSGND